MISLRDCTPADTVAMAALEARATDYPWSPRQYLDSLAGDHHGLALEETNTLLGHVMFMTVLDEAEILNIVIEPSRQGQGLGRKLLEYVLQSLKQKGIHRVFLEVRESNLPARTLYQHCGFTESGLRKNYYPGNNGREHAILMEVAL